MKTLWKTAGVVVLASTGAAWAQSTPTTTAVLGTEASNPIAQGLGWATRPTLNNAGEVALVAGGVGTEYPFGIWIVGADGVPRNVVARGDLLPDASDTFLDFGGVGVSLNDAGDVAFFGQSSTDDVREVGLYVFDDGAVTEIGDAGDDLAGGRTISRFELGVGSSGGPIPPALLRPTISDDGLTAAVYYSVSGTSGAGVIAGGGVIEPTTVAFSFTPSPTSSNYLGFIGAPPPPVDDQERVNFYSRLQTNVDGLFRESTADGVPGEVMILEGETVGGELILFANPFFGRPTVAQSSGLVYAVGRVGINEVPTVLAGDDGAVSVVASAGDPLLNRPGDVLDSMAVLDANNVGQAVVGEFVNNYRSGAIRVGAEGAVRIFEGGDPAPDGNGTFDAVRNGLGMTPDGDASINDAGQVVFAASLSNTVGGDADDVGIFFFDDRLGLLTVAREGDTINGQTLTFILTETGEFGGGDNGDAFNEHGQVAFLYQTGDVLDGRVAVWTPPSIDDIVPGDANLDGVVDLADFGVLRANFGETWAYLTTADFDGDRDVDLADFGILRANFGGSASDLAALDAWAVTVPEPAMAGVLAVGAVVMLRRRP
ncbi:MAG: choice-of-anchor tandem repeat NxxGxxAF-containing protein [Planctomycetota bacterium]